MSLDLLLYLRSKSVAKSALVTQSWLEKDRSELNWRKALLILKPTYQMRQRIQIIFLLLAVFCGVLMVVVPLYSYVENFRRYWQNAGKYLEIIATATGLSILGLLSIFLHKDAGLQKKLILSASLLSFVLIGLVVWRLRNNKYIHSSLEFAYSWGAILPFAMVAFFMMAWSKIRDEN